MFKMLKNTIKTGMTRKMALLAAAAAGIAAVTPQTALAHGRDRDHDFGLEIRIGSERPSRRWIPPVVEERCRQVWIEPVYRTVCDRVWVPDRFEDRQVVHYWHGWRQVRVERVLVQQGHYEDVQRQECVTPGHWETRIERVRCN